MCIYKLYLSFDFSFLFKSKSKLVIRNDFIVHDILLDKSLQPKHQDK